MYNIGDMIVYGSSGVCAVTDIAVPDFNKGVDDRLYYVLKPVEDACVIYTPVDTPVFMRHIITREEAERLIDTIPTVEAEAFMSRSAAELETHYKSALKSHDCSDLIELIMSIYNKKIYSESQQRRFGQVDERFMKHAEKLLYNEFSAALGIPRDEVQEYIASRVNLGKDTKD